MVIDSIRGRTTRVPTQPAAGVLHQQGDGPPRRRTILGCPTDNITMDEALDRIHTSVVSRRPLLATPLNANTFYCMRRHGLFKQVVLSSEMVIPEYVVVWASRIVGEPLLWDVCGPMPALAGALLRISPEKGYRIYLLGTRQEVMEQAVRNVKRRCPEIRIVGYHSGYFDGAEETRILRHIEKADPDVLFVAMGTPKQEIWMWTHTAEIAAPVRLGVGGYFDVLAGLRKESPWWIRRCGLEWVYRAAQDPKLWRRYVACNPEFILRIVSQRIRRNGKMPLKDDLLL